MLEELVDRVSTENLPSYPLLQEGRFHEEADLSEALRGRLEVWFRLSGTAWQEVKLLTTVFDRIFADINAASDMHFSQASRLFAVLHDIHGPATTEIPRLTHACDKLVRCAVASEKDGVQQWLLRWQANYMETGCRVWNFPVDDRLRNFLHQHANGCEPEAWSRELTEGNRVSRECSMVRELLSMSPSALFLSDVRNVLFTRRQDVLFRYIRDVKKLAKNFPGI